MKIQEFVNLNKFATELQNRGYTFGVTSQEVAASRRDRIMNKINNTSPLKGYQIIIVQKPRIIEESGRNR